MWKELVAVLKRVAFYNRRIGSLTWTKNDLPFRGKEKGLLAFFDILHKIPRELLDVLEESR